MRSVPRYLRTAETISPKQKQTARQTCGAVQHCTACFFTHLCSAKGQLTHVTIKSAHTAHFGQAWHKAPRKVEWWVLELLYIGQPGHKLNQGGTAGIQPSRQVRCSASPVAAGFSSLCLLPGPAKRVLIFLCLIMKVQLEERLSTEKKVFAHFVASPVRGEQRVEQTESSFLLDGEHGDIGKHFT